MNHVKPTSLRQTVVNILNELEVGETKVLKTDDNKMFSSYYVTVAQMKKNTRELLKKDFTSRFSEDREFFYITRTK